MNEIFDNKLLIDDNSSDDESCSKYSDQVNSDIENELYSNLHFFDSTKSDILEISHVENSTVNYSHSKDIDYYVSSESQIEHKTLSTNKQTNNLNKFIPNLESLHAAKVINKRDEIKKKSALENIEELLFNTNRDQNSFQAESNAKSKNVQCYESDSSDKSFCFNEWPPVNMRINIEDSVMNNPSSENSNSVIDNNCILNYNNELEILSNEADGEILSSLNSSMPVVNESFSNNSSSDDMLSKSLPTKFKKVKNLKVNKKETWHIDPQDRVLPKKRISRFFNELKCRICKQEDHPAKLCPNRKLKKCFICGSDHLSKYCNKKVCSFCYNIGHQFGRCPRRRGYQIYCEICGISGHTFNRCPDLWRRFHATTSSSECIVESPSNVDTFAETFCYNCGIAGHVGHECLQPKSQNNSPSWPFVMSYENPERLLATSCELSDRSPKLKFRSKKQKQKFDKSDNFTPRNCDIRNSQCVKDRIILSRNRKLSFENRDFQRTPNNLLKTNKRTLKRRKCRAKKKKAKCNPSPEVICID